jgi:group I intron endonuclease
MVALSIIPEYYIGVPPAYDGTAPLTTLKVGVRAMADETVSQRHYVYKMTCSDTGKSYIGMTKNLKHREMEHRGGNSPRKLRAAIELYGEETFVFEVIQECDSRAEARELEKRYIAELNTGWPNGYNIHWAPAGTAAAAASPRSRARRSAAQKRLWEDPAHREIVSQRLKAWSARPENKAQLSERATARWADPSYREKQVQSHWSKGEGRDETLETIRQLALERDAERRAAGITLDRTNAVAGIAASWKDPEKRGKRIAAIKAAWDTPEGIAKREQAAESMRQENARRNADPAYREKMRKVAAKRRGHVPSAETRAKMSAAAKARRARDREEKQ